MTGEHTPRTETETRELEGYENPVSARVIDLVVTDDGVYLTDTGLYRRQTHDKDGSHYFVAYNPHSGSKSHVRAQCFVVVNSAIDSVESGKFVWDAVDGPSSEDDAKVNSALTALESLTKE